jgi:hypothetical protein
MALHPLQLLAAFVACCVVLAVAHVVKWGFRCPSKRFSLHAMMIVVTILTVAGGMAAAFLR